MDVGIAFANTGPFATAAGVVELATAAEAAGFDSPGEDPVGAAEEFAAIGVSRIIVPGYVLARGDVAENAAALSERIVGPLQAVSG